MLTVVVGVLLWPPMAGALARHQDGSVRAPAQAYVVRPGDSVWSIAERFGGGHDPRNLVDAIVARNHVDPGSIVPGQTLLIPSFG